MAKVEVDEVELLNSRQLRDTVSKILNHPKAGPLVEEALKMVDPNAKTPRLDAVKIQNEPLEAMEKKFNDFVAETKKEKTEREDRERVAKLTANFEAGRTQLRQAKWTDDGIKKLEEFMEAKGIIDHEIAAAAFEKLHPPATPVMPGGTGAWNFLEMPSDGDADLKKLIESKGENNSLLDKMAHDALNEVRGQPRR